MSTKFTNNASSKLTQALTADATSMHIQAEDVSKFPVLGAEDFCRLTIVGDHGDHEIVKVTSISSDGTCTIERAQESTTAKEWPIENKVELRITAEYLNSITTSEDVLSLVSPIEEDISNIKNNITDIENKHASDIEAVNSSITAVQEDIENDISVSISNLEQSISDTTSSLTDMINSVDEKAEASYVKKGGDSMTGSLLVKAPNPVIAEFNTNITKGTAPAETSVSQIKYADKDGNLTGAILNAYTSDNNIKSALIAVDPSSNKQSELSVMWSNGVACGYAPSPNINASGSEVTTASWVNSKLSKYLPLTGGTITNTLTIGGTAGYSITPVQDGTSHALLLFRNNNNGSYLWLRDNEDTVLAGGFDLSARLGDSIHALVGRPDGSLYWSGKHVVRSVGGAYADAAGNVNAPYLSLNGGIFNNSTVFTSDSTLTQIVAGNGGGYCSFFKSNHSTQAGAAEIVARNASNAAVHSIKATRAGCFADGVHIARSVNGISADAKGNISLNIAGIKVNNAAYADSAGFANSVVTCAYMATQYISNPNTITATVRITTPNWGNYWYVLGHSTLGGGNNNSFKTYNVSSIYGPNTNVVNETVNAGQTNPNYRWTYSGIVCIRIS